MKNREKRWMVFSLILSFFIVSTPFTLFLTFQFISVPYFTSKKADNLREQIQFARESYGDISADCIDRYEVYYYDETIWGFNITSFPKPENDYTFTIRHYTFFNIKHPNKITLQCNPPTEVGEPYRFEEV